jgi:hypothetical protein
MPSTVGGFISKGCRIRCRPRGAKSRDKPTNGQRGRFMMAELANAEPYLTTKSLDASRAGNTVCVLVIVTPGSARRRRLSSRMEKNSCRSPTLTVGLVLYRVHPLASSHGLRRVLHGTEPQTRRDDISIKTMILLGLSSLPPGVAGSDTDAGDS